jgi:hypothetical protein
MTMRSRQAAAPLLAALCAAPAAVHAEQCALQSATHRVSLHPPIANLLVHRQLWKNTRRP